MARIERSIDVNLPVHAVYKQLTHFEQYPRFMENVTEVRRLDNKHLHWQRGSGGKNIEWDAEITEQVPDRCIAWRSVGGPRSEGRVQLRQDGPERTGVTLILDGEPEMHSGTKRGSAGDVLAQRTEQDLARFKKFVEGMHGVGEWRGSGHVAQAEADLAPAPQPAGTAIGKAVGQSASERAEAGDAVMSAGVTSNSEVSNSATSNAAAPDSVASDAWLEQRAAERRLRPSARLPGRLPNLLQAWSEPLGMMRKVSEEMEQVARKFMIRPPFGIRGSISNHISPSAGTTSTAASTSGWAPPVEVARRDNRFIVCAELPGVRREDVQVEIKNGRLTIQGDRFPQPGQGQPEFHRSERAYGHFYRVVALPDGADDETASASMRDGVLEITVPIAGARHGRHIDIQGA